MGMGFAAGTAWVIDTNSLKGKTKKAYEAFVDTLKKVEVDIETFAREIEYDELGESEENLEASIKALESYKFLQNAFRKETGLEMGLGFHNSDEEGDRYDDVNGAYWWVDGLFQETKEYKKAKKAGYKISKASFVQYG